jgi:hypothetical protein
MSQLAGAETGSVGVKYVTKKLRDGTIKRYRYYQLVRVQRRGGKVKTEYLQYLGKDRPRPKASSPPTSSPSSSCMSQPDITRLACMSQLDLTQPTCMSQPPHLPMEIEEHVTANWGQARDPPPPLDLEVLPPEGQGLWSFPLYRAICRRCGRPFEMIKFEVELGHYLCHKCRFEIIRLGERSAWPGY